MTLPMGTIVRLLGKHSDKKFEALGSLNNVYQSLVDIPECYLSSEECKFMLLNPTSVSYDLCKTLKLEIDDSQPTKYFRCCSNDLNTFNKAKCGRCGMMMNSEMSFKPSSVSVGAGVFLSDLATFIVTDDLCVMPFTTTSSIKLLTDLGITNVSRLEERKIDIGHEQMMYLLKLGLSFNSALTNLVHHMTNPNRELIILGEIKLDQFNLVKKEASPSSTTMHLEVSLQKSTGKFLFAEATEDFVDFVFGFLAIPLGTLIGTLMNGDSSLVCMDNIFKSISSMSVGRYLKSQNLKDILVKPQFGQKYPSKNRLFPLNGTVNVPSGYTLKDPRIEGGLLKPSGMFMITDDLVITPSSLFLTMDILNKLKVPFNDIEKHEINIGLEEGLRMLKASLRSMSTLTTSLKHQLKK